MDPHAEHAGSFLSGPPSVELVNVFARPFDNAVATARTCYSSKGIITAAEVAGDGLDAEVRARRAAARDELARSIYQAGHHTTLQHAHFQFALDRVSRHCIWSFLHSHPYYNSEQVSQRYVEVKPGSFAIPALEGTALEIYLEAQRQQMSDYHQLIELLTPVAEAEYLRLFPARRRHAQLARDVRKKAQEVARYVLPVATFAYLYHTVSGLTLLRYWRMCNTHDTPTEQRALVGRMIAAARAHDPSYDVILQDPIPLEETPEAAFFSSASSGHDAGQHGARFARELDLSLGDHTSLLVAPRPGQERLLADAVRETLGLPTDALSDADAIALVLDPARNRLLGEPLNLLTQSKLGRALQHVHYSFRKKLSHAADSQDQRHRMTPASRPVLQAHLHDEPDFITPRLVIEDSRSGAFYRASMERSWAAFRRLRDLGVSTELASYLLPNALAIRFTESADLLNLHHKLKSRLCYNAQEEIWRASVDEARQISELEPLIGRHLLPPCTLRSRAGTRPICPEGPRYCGVPVWKLAPSEYTRLL